MRRARRALLVVALVLLAGACHVRTDVGIHVNADGSGQVSVAVTLDADAVTHAGDPQSLLKVDDLSKAGWTVTQSRGTDGSQTFTATKGFANPTEADAVFNELAGSPFQGFHLTRSRSFAKTTTEFTGTVDFAKGAESFADPELSAALDGKPLGDAVQAIEARIGQKLDDVFQFRIAVRLPGSVTSNAPGQASNGAVWEPKLSQTATVSLEAKGEAFRTSTLVFTAIAIAAFIGLLIVLLIRLAIRVNRRRRAERPAT